MKEELFQELLQSVSKMKAIRSGKAKPSRSLAFDTPAELANVHDKLGVSIPLFARLLGINEKTFRTWSKAQHPHPSRHGHRPRRCPSSEVAAGGGEVENESGKVLASWFGQRLGTITLCDHLSDFIKRVRRVAQVDDAVAVRTKNCEIFKPGFDGLGDLRKREEMMNFAVIGFRSIRLEERETTDFTV